MVHFESINKPWQVSTLIVLMTLFVAKIFHGKRILNCIYQVLQSTQSWKELDQELETSTAVVSKMRDYGGKPVNLQLSNRDTQRSLINTCCIGIRNWS